MTGLSMTDRASHPVPEQSRFRRALAAVGAVLQSLDYTSDDYAMERIERLELEVGRLKQELLQRQENGAVHAPNTEATALEH